ncbi:MAG: DUF3392 domain-containing protein [Oceanisphaera sp.]|uniref:DUF3392 domain-containing protein n=1 Tax=Oceanisphaera sp. TaxID=1929979 RepID=UPI003F9CA4A5
MDLLSSLLSEWGGLLRPYIREIALAMVTTCLVIFGDDINRIVRRQVSHLHFILRTGVFILLCAVGYGALTVFLTPVVAKQLVLLSNTWLLWACCGFFIILGVLAQRKRQL